MKLSPAQFPPNVPPPPNGYTYVGRPYLEHGVSKKLVPTTWLCWDITASYHQTWELHPSGVEGWSMHPDFVFAAPTAELGSDVAYISYLPELPE